MYKSFKKYTLFLILFMTSLFVISCKKKTSADIVTTLYPQYDIAKQIAGDKLSVKLMTPFGSEVHSYEPTAHDILNIKQAKLFIYTSNNMERWASNVIDKDMNALDLSKAYTSDLISDDLHYWTDPIVVLQLISVIRDRIIEVDPLNAAYYTDNAHSYSTEIKLIHQELSMLLMEKENPSIFFFGHNALASFGKRYHLNVISLSSNYKPDADLSPGQLLTLKQKIKDANATFLFVEELISLRDPNALKNELEREGYFIEILELHGFHNISSKQNKMGVRYADLLRQNLKNLEKVFN